MLSNREYNTCVRIARKIDRKLIKHKIGDTITVSLGWYDRRQLGRYKQTAEEAAVAVQSQMKRGRIVPRKSQMIRSARGRTLVLRLTFKRRS